METACVHLAATGSSPRARRAQVALPAGRDSAADLRVRRRLNYRKRHACQTQLNSSGPCSDNYFFISFSISGDRKLDRCFGGSPRPANFCAIERNVAAVRWFAAISAIIWPLFAAAPNTCGSNGIVAIGLSSSALAKSAAFISGRLGTPPWLRQ